MPKFKCPMSDILSIYKSNMIMLEHLPVDKSVEFPGYVEIFNEKNLKEGEYYVDYTTGIIYFKKYRDNLINNFVVEYKPIYPTVPKKEIKIWE